MIAVVLGILVSLEGQTPQHRRFMQPSLPARTLTCISCTCSDSTNYVLRSNTFANAAWIPYQNLSAVPVVTASDGSGIYADPAGGNTAVRMQASDCSTGNAQSLIYQQVSGVALGPIVVSVFFKPFTGTATTALSVAAFDGTTFGPAAPCTSTAGGWVRCDSTMTSGAATPYILIGCNNGITYAGHSNTGAVDVLLYVAQLEVGATPTCPIVTTAAAVSRTGACSAVCR